jgi:riboflavin kinase
MSGPVAKGFQRGSAKLGFPTANLPCSLFQDALADLDTGVYVGWAGLRGEVRKCVCNVGFSPSFVGNENPEKILEAYIIAGLEEVPQSFYGEQLRVLLLGYIRPERRFDFSNGPGELIAAITDDVATAAAALDAPPMKEYRLAPWLVEKGEGATYELMDPGTVR